MATDWEIHGLAFGNCNCDYSCPCQFEALPTNGDCRGVSFYAIDRGYFGDLSLDGLKMGMICSWPGPVHEGRGKYQPFIDAKADDLQRDALLQIMLGREAEPFSNVFSIYIAMSDTIYDPVYTEIELEMDMDRRSAEAKARNLCEASGEPIIGVAGNEHRAQICLPNGVEYKVAEIGRGRCRAEGKIAMEIADGYAQFNEVHLNRNGIIS